MPMHADHALDLGLTLTLSGALGNNHPHNKRPQGQPLDQETYR
jgi:hypothetical protein